MRLIFLLLFTLVFITAYAQKDNNGLPVPKDSSAIIKFGHPSGIHHEPLLVMGKKRFTSGTLQRYFFSVNDIESIRVIGPRKDSIKYFGESGKYGVVILEMKHPVRWISSKKIARQQLGVFTSHRDILFEVDGKEFGSIDELYFAEGFIKAITVSNASSYYGDKRYQKKIKVTTFNPMP